MNTLEIANKQAKALDAADAVREAFFYSGM